MHRWSDASVLTVEVGLTGTESERAKGSVAAMETYAAPDTGETQKTR